MTLDTRILIHRPVAVEAVLDFCNRELLRADNPPRWDHRPALDSLARVGNRPGLGLAAIVGITYRPDGPIAAEFYADDDEPAEGYGADLGSMVVSFDTAYGFGRHREWGCGDLHAYFIERLAHEFGPVTWQNEHTGEWHRYPDAAAALLGLGNPDLGRQATQQEVAA